MEPDAMIREEAAELRAQHPNVLLCPTACRACRAGVPYPELSADEVREALDAGSREAEEAYPALFGRPGR